MPSDRSRRRGHSFSLIVVVFNLLTHFSFRILFVCYRLLILFKSNVRETWRVILVSEADIFLSESLRILAERLSQSENGLPLRDKFAITHHLKRWESSRLR